MQYHWAHRKSPLGRCLHRPSKCSQTQTSTLSEFDTQIANGAIHLGVTKQQLHRAEISGLPIDLGDFGSSHRVRSVCAWLQSDRPNPVLEHSGILAR